jgi:hypothetical protein
MSPWSRGSVAGKIDTNKAVIGTASGKDKIRKCDLQVINFWAIRYYSRSTTRRLEAAGLFLVLSAGSS